MIREPRIGNEGRHRAAVRLPLSMRARRAGGLRVVTVVSALAVALVMTSGMWLSGAYLRHHLGGRTDVSIAPPAREERIHLAAPPLHVVPATLPPSSGPVRDAEHAPVTFVLDGTHHAIDIRGSALTLRMRKPGEYKIHTLGHYLLEPRLASASPASRFVHGQAARQLASNAIYAQQKATEARVPTGRVFAAIEGSIPGQLDFLAIGPESTELRGWKALYLFVLTDHAYGGSSGTIPVQVSGTEFDDRLFSSTGNAVYIGDDDYSITDLDPKKVYDVVVHYPDAPSSTFSTAVCLLRGSTTEEAVLTNAVGIGGQQYVLPRRAGAHFQIIKATSAKFALLTARSSKPHPDDHRQSEPTVNPSSVGSAVIAVTENVLSPAEHSEPAK